MVRDDNDICRYCRCCVPKNLTLCRNLDVPGQQNTMLAGRHRQHTGRIVAGGTAARLRVQKLVLDAILLPRLASYARPDIAAETGDRLPCVRFRNCRIGENCLTAPGMIVIAM